MSSTKPKRYSLDEQKDQREALAAIRAVLTPQFLQVMAEGGYAGNPVFHAFAVTRLLKVLPNTSVNNRTVADLAVFAHDTLRSHIRDELDRTASIGEEDFAVLHHLGLYLEACGYLWAGAEQGWTAI